MRVKTLSFVTIFDSEQSPPSPFVPSPLIPPTRNETTPQTATPMAEEIGARGQTETSQSMYLKIIGAVLGTLTLILIFTGAYRKIKGI